MTVTFKCQVCKDIFGGKQTTVEGKDSSDYVNCEFCGRYRITDSVLAGRLTANNEFLTTVQLRALSHFIQKQNGDKKFEFLITSYWLDENVEKLQLPTPAEQATNTIRWIGDAVRRDGFSIGNLPKKFISSVGLFNVPKSVQILEELKASGLVYGKHFATSSLFDWKEIDLTLKGWERYEAIERGKFAGNYGFIAMKFNTPDLDPLVSDVVKPLIKDKLKINIVSMQDTPQAGIIDNIMRQRIRDAKFVLVDLTHDNSGAYWEAGYAEGLGKPVIYICEQTKFDEKTTHFDTNHCTTVMWEKTGDNAKFKSNLIATLRRSLNLFD